MSDPGYLPRFKTVSGRSKEIRTLAKEGKLSPRYFCTSCLIQRPLRSKHCRYCDRCVACFDHHCPWTYNCVGTSNHRDFLVFVITLTIGIIIYLYLGYAYLTTNYLTYVPMDMPCIYSEQICGFFQQSPFITFSLLWSGIQLFWVILVMIYQLYLIARATTTNEQINYDKYSYFIASPLTDEPPPRQTSSALNQLTNFFLSRPNSSLPPPHRKYRNPFNQGIIRNCLGFWSQHPGPNYWKSIMEPPTEVVYPGEYGLTPLREIATSSGHNLSPPISQSIGLSSIPEEGEENLQ